MAIAPPQNFAEYLLGLGNTWSALQNVPNGLQDETVDTAAITNEAQFHSFTTNDITGARWRMHNGSYGWRLAQETTVAGTFVDILSIDTGQSAGVGATLYIRGLNNSPTLPLQFLNFSQYFFDSDTIFNALTTFNFGITGTGNTGALTAGSGILSTANTWTVTQTFPNASIKEAVLANDNTGGIVNIINADTSSSVINLAKLTALPFAWTSNAAYNSSAQTPTLNVTAGSGGVIVMLIFATMASSASGPGPYINGTEATRFAIVSDSSLTTDKWLFVNQLSVSTAGYPAVLIAYLGGLTPNTSYSTYLTFGSVEAYAYGYLAMGL